MSFALPFVAPLIGAVGSSFISKKLAPKPPKPAPMRPLPTVQDTPERAQSQVVDIAAEGVQGSQAEQQARKRRAFGRAGNVVAGRSMALQEQQGRLSSRLLG